MVRDVRSGLNENNYAPVNVSSDIKFKVIIQNKTRNNPGKSVTWSAAPIEGVRRQGVENILGLVPGTNAY